MEHPGSVIATLCASLALVIGSACWIFRRAD